MGLGGTRTRPHAAATDAAAAVKPNVISPRAEEAPAAAIIGPPSICCASAYSFGLLPDDLWSGGAALVRGGCGQGGRRGLQLCHLLMYTAAAGCSPGPGWLLWSACR